MAFLFQTSHLVCVGGLTAAALTSYLLSRFQQKKPPSPERAVQVAAAQTELELIGDLQEPALQAAGAATNHQDTAALGELVENSGPLIQFKNYPRDIESANRMFAYTFSQEFFNDQQVELKLQHKSCYSGLKSEHWWVLSNEFYRLYPGLPPLHEGTVRAEACIKLKRVGHHISEVYVNLRTERTPPIEVQGGFWQRTVSQTYKGVAVGEDGRWHSSESSDIYSHQMPLITPAFTRPPGPPPGFY